MKVPVPRQNVVFCAACLPLEDQVTGQMQPPTNGRQSQILHSFLADRPYQSVLVEDPQTPNDLVLLPGHYL